MGKGSVDLLLVEDNPNDVELMLHALHRCHLSGDFQVVRDGAEALAFIFCTDAYAQRHVEDGPKVVLLDLKLPKVDGLEVLQRIKSDPRTRTIPVVVFTSSRNERDIRECYRWGANSYVVKSMGNFAEVAQQVGRYWLTINEHPPANPGRG